MIYSNFGKKKTCQPRLYYLVKLSFIIEGEIEFLDRQKLKRFIITRPALLEVLKGILQDEIKRC